MYTRSDLVADVLTEVNNIKQYATPAEISKLNFIDLESAHREKCIYGQMTGNCFSARAVQLIEMCTPRYFTDNVMPMLNGVTIDMGRVSKNVNGTHVEDFAELRNSEDDVHYSAIEVYILLYDAKNENLINLIKGNIQTAEL